jgi:predicted AlkP superfamily pyrophosphatase or phosphodiesterase
VKNKVMLIVVLAVLLCTLLPACAPGQTTAERPDQKYVVVIVIDACRPDYFDIADIHKEAGGRGSYVY